MGKYLESFIDHLDTNEDEHEYVLFMSEREFDEFSPKSPRIQRVKTAIKSGGIMEHALFPLELQKKHLDLVLFPTPHIPLFYFGKSVIILPDLVSYFYPEKHLSGSFMRFIQTFLLRMNIQKASTIIVLGEVLKRDIIEIFDTKEEKIHIIPPMHITPHPSPLLKGEGVKNENNLPSPSRRRVGDEVWENEGAQFLRKENLNGKYILCVWELREYKNIPRLLTAYNLLVKEDKTDIDLILIWKEDPSYHEIRSTLIALGLQSRVHIYNVLDDEKIGLLYQNASLYVLPSLYEGSEQAILEPLSYNIPIASASLPSITSILTKDDALFFRPMSVSDIRDALKKGLSNPMKKDIIRDMSRHDVSNISTQILKTFS